MMVNRIVVMGVKVNPKEFPSLETIKYMAVINDIPEKNSDPLKAKFGYNF